MALVQSGLDWNWEATEASLVRALELSPGYVFAHQVYGSRLGYLGRLDEAVGQFRTARELDPLGVNPVREVSLGWVLARQGDHEQARRVWEADRELHAENPTTHLHLGNDYCETGMLTEGIASLKRALALSPDDARTIGDLAYCYARAGERDEALELARVLEQRSKRTYVSPLSLAIIHVGLGDHDTALAWLERAHDLHAVGLPVIATDSRYAPLRSDPRFASLVQRVGLAGAVERTRAPHTS